MTDSELLNWLEKQDGAALINDDCGNWAFSSLGVQPLIEHTPDDMWTTYVIEKHAFKNNIREAIEFAIKDEIQPSVEDGMPENSGSNKGYFTSPYKINSTDGSD